MIVEARDLTVRYPGSSGLAVDGLSFAALTGQLLAITGPNGCGKTTVIRALLGQIVPERGVALLQSRPVDTWTREARARAVGVVAQREEIVFPIRVEEMVMLGRYSRLGRTAAVGSVDREAVARALDRCDATQLARRWVDQLSGGEWQRVRVARALAQEPEVLILDEPTMSLDVRHEMELFELMRQLADDGLTVIAITHALNLAARFADRILLMEQGRLAHIGPPADVLDREIIGRVFAWPVEVTAWRGAAPQVIPLRRSETESTGSWIP